MKKFYLIQLVFDHGYYSSTMEDFRGYLQATKYEVDPRMDIVDKDDYWITEDWLKATTKKPCCVVEVWENCL
jgi:elongation factor P hydroxylase